MYAVVKTGGKQHRVSKGEKVTVDRLAGDVGSELVLDEVLLIGGEGDPKIGMPVVAGAKVTAKVIGQGRGAKVHVFKKRRRQGSKKLIGHRQYYTELEITGIQG